MLLAQKKINKYLSLFLPCLWSFLSINCPYSYFHSHDSAWLNATLYKHQEYYYHGLAGGGGCIRERMFVSKEMDHCIGRRDTSFGAEYSCSTRWASCMMGGCI